MQPVAHGGHHAEVAAAATQRPEEFGLVVRICQHDASVRENNLRGEQVIQREPEAADQRPITAAQCEPCHADGSHRARHGRKVIRFRRRENARSAHASGDARGKAVRTDEDVVHGAQIDHDTAGERTSGPVMAAAKDRERQLAIACGLNG